MAADITVDKAELVAVFVEALLYGIYLVYFFESIAIILLPRDRKGINWTLFAASIAIFITSTGHLSIILARALEAFIDHRNDPRGPIGYYANTREALEVAQASCQVAVSLLGDGMAIYRVYAVYAGSYYVIILPIMMFIGTAVTSIASAVIIGQMSSQADIPFYTKELETWMPIFFGLSFLTSVTCSILISCRLWSLNRNVSRYSTHRRITDILRIMVESASLYSAAIFVYFVTYLAKTNYSIIFGDMTSPIIGIAFSLITIRVHQAFSTASAPTSVEGMQFSSRSLQFAPPSRRRAAANKEHHPMSPLEITITRQFDSQTSEGDMPDAATLEDDWLSKHKLAHQRSEDSV